VIGAGIVGIGGALLFKENPLVKGRTYDPRLVRPPGAPEETEFLGKCIRCGECMKVCPTNAIQPAMFEAGLEEMWTPVVKQELAYCEYKCNMRAGMPHGGNTEDNP
jgi:ferredoxin